MNTQRYIADAMTAMLNNDNDRAIGLLLRASLAYDDEISRQREVATDDLKPMKPISKKKQAVDDRARPWPKFLPERGGIRQDSPALVPCEVCGSPKGHLCIQVIGDHVGDPLKGKSSTGKPTPGWHKERKAAAQKKRGTS